MLAWSLVAVACGQVATATGWVYSYVPSPDVYGLSALSALILVFVMRVVGMTSEERERDIAARDVQAAKRERAEQALQRSEERFRALVHNSSDVIMVTDVDEAVTYVSPSIERITGYTAEEVMILDRQSLVHPADHSALRSARALVEAQPGAETRLELRMQHADGRWHWYEVVLRNLVDEPAVGGLVVNFRDVTERRTLEQQIRHQAFHDSLTGLANRELFMDRLEHALAAQRRTGTPLAVMLVDLDDFKAVNDSLGHQTGDELIIEAARRLSASVRPGDTVARLGGDEFAVLLEKVPTPSAVMECAERSLESLKREFHLADHRIPVTASMGVAVGATDTDDAEELLRNADVAMYAAKAKGKGRFEVFELGMHLTVHHKLQLKSDLGRALAAGDQMVLEYQPIVELTTGRPVGVEALVRWDHPSRGHLDPDDFLPLAEACGLVVPLGRWVLVEACRQITDWRRKPGLEGLYVSVNVSTVQLERAFVDDVRAVLRETKLAPSSLVLEITESALVRDMSVAERVLDELKELGVRLAIDDFGTRHASLQYLQRFPIDALKIDRCFISGLADDPHNVYFAEAILKLADRLDLDTIAEGVETTEEIAILRRLGCRYGQGFLLARPDAPETIETLLDGLLSDPVLVPSDGGRRSTSP